MMPPHMQGPGMMPPPGMGPPGYPPPMHPEGGYGGYPQPPPQNNYSFLDPIIPTEKRESPAQALLKPQKAKIAEVYKKLYVGKIPIGVKDNIIERLLKC